MAADSKTVGDPLYPSERSALDTMRCLLVAPKSAYRRLDTFKEYFSISTV